MRVKYSFRTLFGINDNPGSIVLTLQRLKGIRSCIFTLDGVYNAGFLMITDLARTENFPDERL